MGAGDLNTAKILTNTASPQDNNKQQNTLSATNDLNIYALHDTFIPQQFSTK